MKKVTAAALALSLALLSGCSRQHIRKLPGNRPAAHHPDHRHPDRGADGSVVLSISAGRLGGRPSVCMGRGPFHFGGAWDLLQNFTPPNEVLFYSHKLRGHQRWAKAGMANIWTTSSARWISAGTPSFSQGSNAGDLVLGAAGGPGVTDVPGVREAGCGAGPTAAKYIPPKPGGGTLLRASAPLPVCCGVRGGDRGRIQTRKPVGSPPFRRTAVY